MHFIVSGLRVRAYLGLDSLPGALRRGLAREHLAHDDAKRVHVGGLAGQRVAAHHLGVRVPDREVTAK